MGVISEAVPEAVVDAYELGDAHIEPVKGGLINATFSIRMGAGDTTAILQRLHPIFRAEVNEDIEAVTTRLAAQGLATPRILRTSSGGLSIEVDGAVWRALTFIPGASVDHIDDAGLAREAGALVGRFHRALSGFDHPFAFSRAGVHDTDAHLTALEAAAAASDGRHLEAEDLAQEIGELASLRPRWSTCPERICHGDLKISNIRFARLAPPLATCLLDLDTLGYQTLPYELGDAFRSWCNASREDDPTPRFRVDVFEAGMSGYLETVGDRVERVELEGVAAGIETVCAELAARFCRDVFEDSYFGWDPSRYPSREAHNLARARGQLALARTVRNLQNDLQDALGKARSGLAVD